MMDEVVMRANVELHADAGPLQRGLGEAAAEVKDTAAIAEGAFSSAGAKGTEALAGGFKRGWRSVSRAVSAGIEGTLAATLGGLGPIGGVMADTIANTAQGALNTLPKLLGGPIAAVTSSVLPAIGSLAAGFTASIGPAVAAGAAWLGAMAPVLVAAAPFIAVGAVVAALFVAFQTNFLGIRDIVTSVFNGIANLIGNFVGNMIGAVRQFVGIAASVPGPWQEAAQGMHQALGDAEAAVRSWGTTTETVSAEVAAQVGAHAASERAAMNASAEAAETAARRQTEAHGKWAADYAAGVAGVTSASAQYQGAYTDMAGKIATAVDDAAIEAVRIGGDIPKEIGDAIAARRAELNDGMAQLRDALANELSPAQEIARNIGILTSQELAAGMESQDPVVRAKAQAVQAAARERLAQLGVNTDQIGEDAIEGIRKGLARQAAFKREMEDLIALSKRMGGRISLALADGIKDNAKSARDALHGVTADLKAQVYMRSPAKEGPWSEDGGPFAWMRRAGEGMTANLTAGIQAGMPGLRRSVIGLADFGTSRAAIAALPAPSSGSVSHVHTGTVRHEFSAATLQAMRQAGYTAADIGHAAAALADGSARRSAFRRSVLMPIYR